MIKIVLKALLVVTLSVVLFACSTAEYTVTFIDHDDAVIHEEVVQSGEDATLPDDPERAGYVFTGWDGSHENISEDTTLKAQYDEAPDGDIGERISEVMNADNFTENLVIHVDDALVQSNRMEMTDSTVHLTFEQATGETQSAYFTKEDDTYTEYVSDPVAACYLDGELTMEQFDMIPDAFSWRQYLPAQANEGWFHQDGDTYTLKQELYDTMVTRIGTAFEEYTLTLSDDALTLRLVVASEDTGETYEYVLTFTELGTTSVELPDFETCVEEENESYTYYATDEGLILTGYKGEDEVLEIPEAIDGTPVIAIGTRAFAQTYTIETIIIPDTVTTIGPQAFDDAPSLRKIYIPDSVETIGSNAFRQTYALTIYTGHSEAPEGWSELFAPHYEEKIFDYVFDPDDFFDPEDEE